MKKCTFSSFFSSRIFTIRDFFIILHRQIKINTLKLRDLQTFKTYKIMEATTKIKKIVTFKLNREEIEFCEVKSPNGNISYSLFHFTGRTMWGHEVFETKTAAYEAFEKETKGLINSILYK